MIVEEAKVAVMEAVGKYSVDMLAVPRLDVLKWILNIQDSFNYASAISPSAISLCWETISTSAELSDFILKTTVHWRAVGGFVEARWFQLTDVLAQSADLGAVHHKTIPTKTTNAISNLPAEIASQLTTTEIATDLLNSNPWLVTVVLIALCDSILASVDSKVLETLAKAVKAQIKVA